MRWLRRGLKTLAALAAVLVLWLAVVASGWLPRPTAEELAALESLRPEPANVQGERNAFAALYSFIYDVPDDALEAVARADIEAFLQHPPPTSGAPGFTMLASLPYPAFPKMPSDHPALCAPWQPDCLARVRSDPETVRELIAERAGQLARGDRLAQYDHHRAWFVGRADSPIPLTTGNYFSLLLSAVALDHVDGDFDGAFARLCTTTATWRRLRARTDLLIVDMLGIAQMSGASQLYAEMLAELPAEFEPPCPQVFAPLENTELDQCAVFRGEFLMLENTFNTYAPSETAAMFGAEKGLFWHVADLLVNRARAIRIAAVALGRACMAPHQQRVKDRSPEPLPTPEYCSLQAWVFDPVGCKLAYDDVPEYDAYYRRALDLDGRLRLLGTAMWLRQHAGDDPQAAFDARPTELHSPRHGFTLDAAAGTVRMRPHDQKRGEYWEFPYRAAAPEQR